MKKLVREFKTFTTGLNELADWLKQCGIKTVAMESTGVYWCNRCYWAIRHRWFKWLEWTTETYWTSNETSATQAVAFICSPFLCPDGGTGAQLTISSTSALGQAPNESTAYTQEVKTNTHPIILIRAF